MNPRLLALLPLIASHALALETEKPPFVIQPGRDWAAYDHQLAIGKDSAFDFSFLADAPAGKHGWLKATPAGHFEFTGRPGVRAKFWGVNLCFTANYLTKEGADTLAERLKRSGYNTVRFHHFDRFLTAPGGGLSHILAPEPLDRLDYLFAALKKQGIYINIDLYVNRIFSPAELESFGLDPKLGSKAQNLIKTLIPISDAAFENWAAFSKNLLTHRNPYTGLTWAEDPALIGICPVNEDSLSERINADQKIRARYDAIFAKWHPENKRDGETDDAAFNRFVFETQAASDRRMFAFLGELGVKTLLSGANYRSHQGLAFVRNAYDYVDNHQYFDHPTLSGTSWNLPFEFRQSSSAGDFASSPRGIMPTRLFGKPFVVTEFNFVRPNRFRSEGAVLMPSYASLQDWDGMYNFEYSASETTALTGGHTSCFSLANDPIGLIADRVSALIFLRGDILPAKYSLSFEVDPVSAFTTLNRPFPKDFTKLGLVSRIGSHVRGGSPEKIAATIVNPDAPDSPASSFKAAEDLPAQLVSKNILTSAEIDPDGERLRSDTGEIELYRKQTSVKVITPRTEQYIAVPNVTHQGTIIRDLTANRSSAITLTSLDGEPLADSKRILLTHLTNAYPTGMTFGDETRKRLLSWGDLPHLLQQGTATFSLHLPEASAWKIWIIDSTGKRLRELPVKPADGALPMNLSTITKEGTQLAYELVR